MCVFVWLLFFESFVVWDENCNNSEMRGRKKQNVEKEEGEQEKGNSDKDIDGEQCQLGSNCKSNDGETEVNYLIIIISPPLDS